MRYLIPLAILVLAACGPSPEEPLDPASKACCECLLTAVDPLSEACSEQPVEECSLDLKAGLYDHNPRCYVGPQCRDVCAADYYKRGAA